MSALRADLVRRFLSVLDGTRCTEDVELAEALADSALRSLTTGEGYSLVRVPENTGKHPGESAQTDPKQVIHEARRGNDVEAWIKRHREEYRAGSFDRGRTGSWYALDGLLDDYREHADTGTPLSEKVQGPHGGEED